ncbi:MAG: hypothetical protein RXO32_08735 [Thermoproteus sp.]|jgi:hypothetical protein|uniref:hypothetical protein n=1 Tax=Thermoproteus sp. CP80 TaxID=1650659 RepID=UPI001877370C|nr:hypothetical protein [Thermoproteus sp. CP80]
MIYGISYIYWLVYGSSLDLPAILGRLVGLGYEIGRAGYREGAVYLDPLPGGYAARRVYEEGIVYLLADLQRGALGVFSEGYGLLNRGIADVSRALMELSMPEPPRAELHVSFGLAGEDCRKEKVSISGIEFVRTGLVLMSGEPQGGEGIYVSVTPVGTGRYMAYLVVGGGWQYVLSHMKRIGDLLNSLVGYFVCGGAGFSGI